MPGRASMRRRVQYRRMPKPLGRCGLTVCYLVQSVHQPCGGSGRITRHSEKEPSPAGRRSLAGTALPSHNRIDLVSRVPLLPRRAHRGPRVAVRPEIDVGAARARDERLESPARDPARACTNGRDVPDEAGDARVGARPEIDNGARTGAPNAGVRTRRPSGRAALSAAESTPENMPNSSVPMQRCLIIL